MLNPKRIFPSLARISCFLAILWLACRTFAQIPVPTPAPTSPTPAPLGWDNPQDSVSTFVQDMKSANYWDARKALDLSDIPFAVRDSEGAYDAQLLINVLSRIPNFRVEDLPTEQKSPSFNIPVKLRNGKEIGQLEMRQTNGVWLFTSNTLASLPKFYNEVQYGPQNNELGQFAEPPPDPSMLVRPYIPTFLSHTFLWMEIWQWLGLLVLSIGAMFLAFVVRVIVRVVVHVFLKRWSSILTPNSAKSIRKSLGLWAGVMLWQTGYPYLGLDREASINLIIVVLLKAFIAGSYAWVIDAFFDILMDGLSARATSIVRRADQILIPIAKKFVRFLIFACAILAFAGMMSVNVTGLVTGLGIGGLVLALAGKDSVENIFGSLTIIFDQPFGVGDYIRLANTEGTVEEINLRSTRLRTAQDTIVTVPNTNLITASVENFGARRYRLNKFIFPISYTNEYGRIERYCNEARNMLQANEKVNQELSHVDLDSAESGNLNMVVRVYFQAETYREELALREQLLGGLIKSASDAKVILGPVTWGGINVPDRLQPEKPPLSDTNTK